MDKSTKSVLVVLKHFAVPDHITFLFGWVCSIIETLALFLFGNSRIWLVQDPIRGNYAVSAYSDFMTCLLLLSGTITFLLSVALLLDIRELLIRNYGR